MCFVIINYIIYFNCLPFEHFSAFSTYKVIGLLED